MPASLLKSGIKKLVSLGITAKVTYMIHLLLSSTGTKWRTATFCEAEDASPMPWIKWWIGVQWWFHCHAFITMLLWAWNATFIRQEKRLNCESIRLQTWKALNSCVLCPFIFVLTRDVLMDLIFIELKNYLVSKKDKWLCIMHCQFL